MNSSKTSLNPNELTQLFIKIKSGDENARNLLTNYLYQELRQIASSRRFSFKQNHTLNTTALVNETWLKLKKSNMDYDDKNHFLSVAALAMRQILLDDSRRKSFLKQHGFESFEPGENHHNKAYQDEAQWLHQLDLILNKLEIHNERLALVFNLKFFCGLNFSELAEYFEVSEKTIQRDWIKAKSIIANTFKQI